MSSKNNFSVQIYVFSQKRGGFSLKNLVIFQTVDSKAIKTYPHIKRLLQGYMNGRFYMILILGKNISQ
jgi:hypothetical protein